MCLMFPGMGRNREPPFPLTDKARSLTQTLQIVCLIHFIVAVIYLMNGGSFTSLITPLILCCATCQYQYNCLMFYMFYAIIDFIFCIEPCGISLQWAIYGMESKYAPGTVISCLVMLVFLPIAIYFAFQAYKEWKAL